MSKDEQIEAIMNCLSTRLDMEGVIENLLKAAYRLDFDKVETITRELEDRINAVEGMCSMCGIYSFCDTESDEESARREWNHNYVAALRGIIKEFRKDENYANFTANLESFDASMWEEVVTSLVKSYRR